MAKRTGDIGCIPSGMGGIWHVKVNSRPKPQGVQSIRIDNKQYPDAHGTVMDVRTFEIMPPSGVITLEDRMALTRNAEGVTDETRGTMRPLVRIDGGRGNTVLLAAMEADHDHVHGLMYAKLGGDVAVLRFSLFDWMRACRRQGGADTLTRWAGWSPLASLAVYERAVRGRAFNVGPRSLMEAHDALSRERPEGAPEPYLSAVVRRAVA